MSLEIRGYTAVTTAVACPMAVVAASEVKTRPIIFIASPVAPRLGFHAR